MVKVQQIFIQNVMENQILLHLLKQKMEKNLEDLQILHGIQMVHGYQILMFLYFH